MKPQSVQAQCAQSAVKFSRDDQTSSKQITIDQLDELQATLEQMRSVALLLADNYNENGGVFTINSNSVSSAFWLVDDLIVKATKLTNEIATN